jgi:NADH:ubiquinone oxidoreductase subunit K
MHWKWAVGAAVALWALALAFAASGYALSGQGLVVAVLFFAAAACFVASGIAMLAVARRNRKRNEARRRQP